MSLAQVPTTSPMIQDAFLSLQGPVERRGDRLVFRVPLDAGGEQLRSVAPAASFEEDGDLVVVLPEWLAREMRLHEGSSVHVDDRWGKLNISRLQ